MATHRSIQERDGMTLFREEWAEIVGFPRYSVSTYGRVRDNRKNRILSRHFTQGGRVQVRLVTDLLDRVAFYVDVLVVFMFFDEDVTDMQIVHLDGNKSNNDIRNIELAPKTRRGRRREPLRVINVDTGEVFPSIAAAARSRGLVVGRVAYAIRTPNRRVGGYRFEILEED